MTQIGTTVWDTELMVDRIDAYRRPRNQDISGVDRLDLATGSPFIQDVPCFIQTFREPEPGSLGGAVIQQARLDFLVSFAEDIQLRVNDLLISRPPSLADRRFLVNQVYSEGVGTIRLYLARCKQIV